MYLSPRIALSSLASKTRAGFRLPEGGKVVPLVVNLAGGSLPAAGSCWTRHGSGITPGTGEPVGSGLGLVCMSANLPERRSPTTASHRSMGRLFRRWDD